MLVKKIIICNFFKLDFFLNHNYKNYHNNKHTLTLNIDSNVFLIVYVLFKWVCVLIQISF